MAMKICPQRTIKLMKIAPIFSPLVDLSIHNCLSQQLTFNIIQQQQCYHNTRLALVQRKHGIDASQKINVV